MPILCFSGSSFNLRLDPQPRLAMPWACPPKLDPQDIKVETTCFQDRLSDDLKKIGITEADWKQTGIVWACYGSMLMTIHLVWTIILAGICMTLQLRAGVEASIWSLMSAVFLARFGIFYVLPTTAEKLKNKIYAKKNIEVKWFIEFWREGLTFSASSGAQTLGVPWDRPFSRAQRARINAACFDNLGHDANLNWRPENRPGIQREKKHACWHWFH